MIVKSWNVIGLMSGTSLDGIDIVYTRISKENDIYNFNLIVTDTVKYDTIWENNLRNAFNAPKEEIEKLNIAYGNYLGEVVNDFLTKHKIKKVDFIASHGHTIFHKPNEGYTLQIGDGQAISDVTGLKVICDFRTQDVALGGQGAPLVPVGDKLLFSAYDYCLNLGGFANISYELADKRIAFDICPTNIVMNHYTNLLGFAYDDCGKIASTGTINKDLLNELNNIPFYKAALPKSLGFEFVKETVFPMIDQFNLPVETVLRTFVAHIVTQIANCFNNKKTSKVLITGGGAFNTFLINELKKQTNNEIIIPNNEIVNFKEALIFALLGVLRSENEVNCLSSVTGAIKDHSSGKIFVNGK
ncbi:anhydro-N-acetylmuramic acid kinase [Lutibacter sp. HS1-25]|uniref:anhydro-N-acetylmuramic acid kinase n=1 Tax=Lutibacter sp. HS1-25 TaxID=2485000 RepID=UPI001012754B|nr:anhydro-N-acetylmuramic acid kinase [Lutibacter sp. HS1-25]RXP52644.1 anhydro-N-acetylmuramic acid kinase [Lutibacter sp. HS1-25]